MKTWQGAAAFCLNEKQELLMVLQAAPGEEKKWAIPSGGLEGNESFQECCIREVREETGYQVEVVKKLWQKEESVDGYLVTVPYFQVKITGGKLAINDPDNFIYDIRWVKLQELDNLNLTFPGDRDLLKKLASQL